MDAYIEVQIGYLFVKNSPANNIKTQNLHSMKYELKGH